MTTSEVKAPSAAPHAPSAARPPFSGARPGQARRPGGRFGKPFLAKRKVCRFCQDKVDYIDFKNMNMLRNFITERGKILSSRTTGVCTGHQRGLLKAIKRARNIALLPFTAV